MTALIASLILYGTLCAATYYLVARAKVTSFLWRRYPRWLAYWTDCSACSGTWYALGWAFVGQHFNVSHLGLPGPDWFGYVLAAAIGMVWTPVFAWLQTYAWTALMPGDESAEG